MRVLVCGGRDYRDCEHVCEVLSGIHAETPIEAIIHGNARGADSWGGVWAFRSKVKCWPVPAEWAKYGKSAGGRRNQKMLGLKPDLVVAFPGGHGTADMVRRSRKAGIRVIEVSPLPTRIERGEQ
jgi:hypothetical protein